EMTRKESHDHERLRPISYCHYLPGASRFPTRGPLSASHALVDELGLHNALHGVAVLIDRIFLATNLHVRGLCRAGERLAILVHRLAFLRGCDCDGEHRHQRSDHEPLHVLPPLCRSRKLKPKTVPIGGEERSSGTAPQPPLASKLG